MLRRLAWVASSTSVAVGLVAIAAGVRAAARAAESDSGAPVTMIRVPAGAAELRGERFPVEAFEIDALEVSVGDYHACVRAGACPLFTTAFDPTHAISDRFYESSACRVGRARSNDDPMNCVDAHAAAAYCRWVNKRLPTPAQWWAAIAAAPIERRRELHRFTSERFWFTAEWTEIGPGARDSTAVRTVPMWGTSSSGLEELRFQTKATSRPARVRLPGIGFRCAR